jgi:DNA-binding MarR family transcriptional regulator
MGQSGTNSFTTYMREMQRWEKEKQAAPVAPGTAFSVLALLAENAGSPKPLSDLQAASGMGFTDFAAAIKRLQESGYITLSGSPAAESAQLTEFGAEVASLARLS